MSSASGFDVFLSYRSRDRAAVEQVAQWLRAQGLTPYLDRWYLAAGVPWPQALEGALSVCRAVAICIGPGELGPWQQKEAYLALERQTQDGLPVIPVLLPDSEPPLGFLRQNTWIDLRHNVDDVIQLTILRKAILGEAPGPAVRDEVAATSHRDLSIPGAACVPGGGCAALLRARRVRGYPRRARPVYLAGDRGGGVGQRQIVAGPGWSPARAPPAAPAPG